MAATAERLTAAFAARPFAARRAAAPRLARDAWLGIAPLAAVALPLPYLLRFDSSHVVTAVVLAALLVSITLASRRSGLVATLTYLLFLGDYRRYVGFFEGYPASDPLLLVAPVAAGVLFCAALFEQRLSLSGALAKLVAALMVLMVFGIFNPLQGGLDVGAAGALFYLVPLLWFWIGRAYGARELLELLSLRLLLGAGLLATLWGLYQTYFGLLPFEQQWVERVGYGALYISDEVIRAIGFFNSSAEYQRFLLVTAATLIAAWLARRSKAALALPLVLAALFLAAARGPVVMLLGTAVVLVAVAGRKPVVWPVRFVVAGVALGAALVAALLALESASFGGRVTVLVERQVQGLLDPMNEDTSTAKGHLQMIADGIVAGVTEPAGHGLGSTTIAATKFGARTVNAEVDFANIMLALGLLGGLLYVAIICVVLRRALRWWRVERHVVALVTVGIVVVTFGGWLIGGEYSMAALVWFYIGAMDGATAAGKRLRTRSWRRETRPRYA